MLSFVQRPSVILNLRPARVVANLCPAFSLTIMANCPTFLAMILPLFVAALHISSRSNSTGRQLTVPSSSAPEHTTSFSPSHEPSGPTAQPDIGGVSWSASSAKTKSEFKLEAAVLEEVMKTGLAAVDMDEKLEHLAKVLRLFGYKRMASALPVVADSRMLAMWHAPVTIFAIPDAALEAACTGGPLRALVLKQMVLGSYPFSKLSSRPSLRLRTAAFGFCLTSVTTIVWSPSTDDITRVVDMNSVKITHPDLYTDGHFVLHGVKSCIHLPPYDSCTFTSKDRSSFLSKVLNKILVAILVGRDPVV